MTFEELDKELANWVRENRAKKLKVTRRMILKKAEKLFIREKMRVTVVLTGRSDGYKCLPYVLLNRKRPDPAIIQKFKNKLILSWAGRTWMNDELTVDYLRRALGFSLFGKRLLVWDSFRCHFSDFTKQALKQMQIDTALVPGGCTKFIQVSFVSTNFFTPLFRLQMFAGTNLSRIELDKNMKIGCYMESVS